MERVRLIEHKGKKIVLIDVSDCSAAESAEVLRQGRALVQAQAPGSALTLTDVRNARFDDAANEEARTNARVNAPFVKAGALVGVTGLKKIVYTAVSRATGRNYAQLDTREQALDWLASQ